jgi:hypothetical protein
MNSNVQVSMKVYAEASAYEQRQTNLAVNNSKSKNDIYNEVTWNLWYNSRYKRGLS